MLYRLDVAVDEQSRSADETVFSALFLLCALFLVLMLGAAFIRWHAKFKRELRHVNQRIRDSINERERRHYVRRRRNLFLSILPFVKYKYR